MWFGFLAIFQNAMLLTNRKSVNLVIRTAAAVGLCYLYLSYSSITSISKVDKTISEQESLLAYPFKYDNKYTRTFSNNTVLRDIKILHEEKALSDGVLQYTRTQEGAKPDLLWLTLTYDNSSWGHARGSALRTIADFLRIATSQYNASRTSVGILTSSLDEYTRYKSVIQLYDFPRITILMQPGFADAQVTDRAHRHDADIQPSRRAELAKLRNFLMLKALGDEQHIIWLDADVYQLDPGIVSRILSHAQDRDDVGILTARCALRLWRYNYDHNAWRGTRKGPREWGSTEEKAMRDDPKLEGEHLVTELIKGTKSEDLVPLDAVGGTILYMRASLVWQGLNFPYQYVVGTQWGKDGWDGLESEGLCYMSRGLRGGSCMLLGGDWHVLHTTN